MFLIKPCPGFTKVQKAYQLIYHLGFIKNPQFYLISNEKGKTVKKRVFSIQKNPAYSWISNNDIKK